jgi:DNA sulfur modification protein DndB
MKRLEKAKAFYYNDNTYEYINNLIKNYKSAAHYQFLGLIFKNEKINNNTIEIPAIEGRMGKNKKRYYMFSIEPNLLLKLSFILHRTKANIEEMPTYQRLLQPKRLTGITKFIEEGGYFPNSLIVNFNESKKLIFEPASQSTNSSSRIGILKIPNEYAIAYVIDGQHRLYGYANSEFKNTNTVPVVALYGLEAVDQLSIFMDINQNQKAVSASLRGILEDDLYWDHKHASYRLQALRSSIAKQLSIDNNSPLYNKIITSEDSALLTVQPFLTALTKSGLLPIARGDKYNPESTEYSLYNIHNLDHSNEMLKTKKKVTNLLMLCYGFVEENFNEIFNDDKFFIVSNRGTFPFICLIGNLNIFLTKQKILQYNSSAKERFDAMEKYLYALLDGLQKLTEKEKELYLLIRGAGAEINWLRFFQSIINKKFPEYSPIELIDWKERHDKELQNKARKYVEEIERFMKNTILEHLQKLFPTSWDLEIGTIKQKCIVRAEEQKQKEYKEIGEVKNHDWTEMFEINDYKSIIENFWTKTNEVKSFEKIFSIDIGDGFNSKKEKTKWISRLSSYRNQLAHSGSKQKGLNEKEVLLLERIHNHFY